MAYTVVRMIAATLLFGLLSACEPPPSANEQTIVAKVGDASISKAELDLALSRLGNLGEAPTAQARSKVLEALVDQQLVSNAARQAKLDMDPGVRLALQQAQRQVLVEAYIEHLLKDMARPSDAEINDYFTQHPELFSARRIYRIQELQLQMDARRMPEVEVQLKQSPNLAGFGNWLKTQGIQGNAALVVKPAEQLPANLLDHLKLMKDGQITVLESGPARITILQLQSSQLQPVSPDQAREAIEAVLLSGKRKALLDAEIKKLRSSGKIEYAKGFVPLATASQSGKSVERASKP